MSAFSSMFTEVDNKTHDIFKYLACMAVLTGIGLSIYIVVVKSLPFDIQSFGIGMGTLFTGAGAALLMKKDAPVPGQPPSTGPMP